MATTRSRPRGRESARPPAGGAAAEHATKIYGVAIGSVVVIVAFLALTSTGHVIDAATQRFMLYYAGVFALIGLCASVALGLIATDRMVLNPGHRIFVQSAHRAASFGAVVFLLIHIVTEILAQRVHALDAVVPFLSPFRTFYIGLGTIASDLVLLLVITGIMRKRFTTHGKAWRWRAIHYTSYVAFVFGVWHGLLGGRPGKPYVDWSYGFVVALVALGLAVRILANSLRPKETLSGPPVPDSASSGSAPMRAASMFAQLSLVRAAAAAAAAPSGMLSAPVGEWQATQVGPPAPAYAALPPATAGYEVAAYGSGVYDYGYEDPDGRQPFYEPGYEGPPRYIGAPRRADSGPMPRATSGPMPRVPAGQLPRATTGPMPAAPNGGVQGRNSGPMPRATTGPMPAAPNGGVQGRNSGPMPRATTGPMPAAPNGPAWGPGSGPMPRISNSGPMPRISNSGPMPQAPSGPMPAAGPAWPGGGSGPRPASRQAPPPPPGGRRPATGPAAPGPMPAAGSPRPGFMTQPADRNRQQGRGQAAGARGARERARPAAQSWAESDWAASATWPESPGWTEQSVGWPQSSGWDQSPADWDDSLTRWDERPADWDESPVGWAESSSVWGESTAAWGDSPADGNWDFGQPPWDGGAPEPDPGFRYRQPGPGMPGYRGPQYRGGDDLR